jgi:SAM-dependent methyltransferase
MQMLSEQDQRYADKTEGFATRPSSRRMLGQLMDMLDLPEDSSILDIGCGTGIGMRQLQPLYNVVGLDVNPAAILRAKGKGLSAFLYDGENWPTGMIFDYDAVILANTLNHVSDPDGTIWRAFTALRPGGQIGIINPNLWHRRAMTFTNMRNGYQGDATIQNRFTPGKLKKLLRWNFQNVQMQFAGHRKFGAPAYMIATARRPW